MLARVLARRTPILLLDESARAGAGARVLAVPHDLNLAAASALTSELLTNRCRREVEVQAHPRSGTPPVLPVR